jgi:hypothetical protein
VQQIMISCAVTDKEKVAVITEVVLDCWRTMPATVHRPLKIITFNDNGIWRQACEIRKQLHDLKKRDPVLWDILETHTRLW